MTSLPSDTITVSTGALQGRRVGDLTVFRGIPYAAAPVGDLRFVEPAPVVPWDGVRQATAAGPNAPQRTRRLPRLDATPLIGHGWAQGDAYLTLDIWRPQGSGIGGR